MIVVDGVVAGGDDAAAWITRMIHGRHGENGIVYLLGVHCYCANDMLVSDMEDCFSSLLVGDESDD